ncbi:MAG: hypothetical protein O3C21_16155 [Verrucomicrobia bacterium]|nr:hypothetical protein [Verrucomicrobiota bacterium]
MVAPIHHNSLSPLSNVSIEGTPRGGGDPFFDQLPATLAEAELRAAIHAGNKQRAAKVLERAPYLRIHGSKPRPIEQAIDYWRSVCAGIEPDYHS